MKSAVKAHAAAGACLLSIYVTAIVVRVINYNHPGFLDDNTTQAVGGIVDAGLVWLAAYLPSNT